METFNIAILGAAGVGKSVFVQRVLGLTKPPISNSSNVRMVVDNVTHMITLLELDLEDFELNPSQPIQWPKQINGHIVPRVDAALILYDVMNQETIRELPQTLAGLTNTGLPAILVANKCENPEDEWEVDVQAMAEHKYFEACIATYRASVDNPEVSRACVHAIIRAAVAQRKEDNGDPTSRRRAQSAAHIEPIDFSVTRPMSEQSKHSRASSDLSLLRTYGTDNRPQPSRSPRSGMRAEKSDALLDADDDDEAESRYSDDIPILQRNEESAQERSNSSSARSKGLYFDELVDMLLAPRLVRKDINFSDTFLCLYRKFAAPGQLLAAILERLDRVREDKSAHFLSKTATQLRYIEVVAKWVSLYPGDFARPKTRRNLEEFIKHLSTEPIFSIAAQQMRRNLHLNVTEDDDTGWANADEAGDVAASQILSKEMSELSAGISTLSFDDETSGRHSGSSDDRTVSSQYQFSSCEKYEREAALLEPTDQHPMNKFRYHIFMDIHDDDIADELTRMDWIMLSSIRIRDFVRHVSLSSGEKDKCRSLKNVNRMINHFNHVAKWVANMILLRDKAKHRAQIMEKFMNIALKLRQLNNYNGLAAMLAGINSTAIHRLSQTRVLIPVDVQKRFARLVILMGTQKGHGAYRLAWDNSPLPRIPFMPLHRSDLVTAEVGSKTFLGPKADRINWRKFEVLGEVILPIMKSQSSAYRNLTKHDTARELILGCRMPTDDEDIYQRSLQVESNNGAALDTAGRKKSFPWFASNK